MATEPFWQGMSAQIRFLCSPAPLSYCLSIRRTSYTMPHHPFLHNYSAGAESTAVHSNGSADPLIEWWAGLSQKFLSAKCARLLVLAGQERLDRDLMVGQM